VTLCSLVAHGYIGGTYRLHLQGLKLAKKIINKKETAGIVHKELPI
jgi:hypothetical protein